MATLICVFQPPIPPPPPPPAPERAKKYGFWYKILDGFLLLYWTKILPVLESFNVSEEFSTIPACLCDLKPKAEPVCKSISVTKWPSKDNSVADTLATCQIEPLGVQRVQKGLKSQADILVGRSAYPQSTRRVLGLEGRRYTSRQPLLIPVRRSNFTPNKEAKETSSSWIIEEWQTRKPQIFWLKSILSVFLSG